MTSRHLAITMGDPAGIGPEIIVKACVGLKDRIATGDLRLLVIGSGAALDGAKAALGTDIAIPEVKTGDRDWPNLCFLQADTEGDPIKPGVLSADGGRFAYKAIEQGVRLTQAGRTSAIVTAPLNKEALNKAGYHFPGHTEMLAHLTGVRGSVMLLAHGNMRVSHVSTHVALEDVPKRLTPERLRMVNRSHQRCAAAARHRQAEDRDCRAQPACGRGRPVRTAGHRRFGADDRESGRGRPRCRRSRARRYHLRQAARRPIRCRVAMYHDQGHIPVKLLGFQVDPATGRWQELSGVNITLGLPIIRTSVDHGTAFDIAGKGIANEHSLIEAIDYAERLAGGTPASKS